MLYDNVKPLDKLAYEFIVLLVLFIYSD